MTSWKSEKKQSYCIETVTFKGHVTKKVIYHMGLFSHGGDVALPTLFQYQNYFLFNGRIVYFV